VSACLLLVRNGVVYTPPPSEGAVESITLGILTELGRDEGIEIVQRPIDRSELYIADELAATGTITEVTKIHSIDDMDLPADSPVLDRLSARYRDAMKGVSPHPAAEMTVVAGPPAG
jgi:branched-chain amino acid aminotransferase